VSRRQAFLDIGVRERRGVVLLDGRPERLLIERDGEPASQRLGACPIARVRRIERGQKLAFLEMPDGPDAVAPPGRLAEGQAVEVEVTAEARGDKGAAVRTGAMAEGPPRLLKPAPTLVDRLREWAGAPPVEGAEARVAADEAEEAALQPVHTLPGGGRIAIEPTRALVAVDVDIGEARGGDARRLARAVNLAAIAETARLLRLKGLGGLVVLDLVGKGHDGPAMSQAAREAFAVDGAGVSIGPISRFGLFELAIPHRARPVAEVLLDADGRPGLESVCHRLARAVEAEARAAPGGRMLARTAPEAAAVFEPWLAALNAQFGPRIELVSEPNWPRWRFEVKSQ
jgi:Ribonuclease G/E